MGAVLDNALATMGEEKPEAPKVDAPAETEYGPREKQLGKMKVGELRNILSGDYDLDSKGVKADLVTRILNHEFTQPNLVPNPSPEPVAPPAQEPPQYFDGATPEGEVSYQWTGEPQASAYMEMAQPELDEAAAIQRELLEEAMHGGPAGDEAADQLKAMNDPVAAFVAQQPAQPLPHDETGVLRLRQWLFGLSFTELQDAAAGREIDPEQPKNALIQLLIDSEYQRPPVAPPVPDPRTQRVRFEPSGDETTDRLRQMQYNADPAMRRNYGEE